LNHSRFGLHLLNGDLHNGPKVLVLLDGAGEFLGEGEVLGDIVGELLAELAGLLVDQVGLVG